VKHKEAYVEETTCYLCWKHLGVKNSKVRFFENGFPDRIFWLPNGSPFLVEFKRLGELPRPKQKEIHEFLTSLGYEVEVHDNVADAFQAVIEACRRRLAVGARRVPKESNEVLDRASRVCALLRSRSGKD
jgi:hypothetical protein